MLFNSSKYAQAFFLTDHSDLLKTLRSGSSPALEKQQEAALTLPAAACGDHSLPSGVLGHLGLHYTIFLGKAKHIPQKAIKPQQREKNSPSRFTKFTPNSKCNSSSSGCTMSNTIKLKARNILLKKSSNWMSKRHG